MIFNVQRYSTHDGEGIRTVIFFKGCTLHCQWCSNPESQSFAPEFMINEKLCKKIGDCLTGAPCPARAVTITGEEKSTRELLCEIEKDLAFYKQSNGGVTLSGGEPLAQDQTVIPLLKALQKKNIHTAVETSLHVDWIKIKKCIGLVNTYLVDVKHLNNKKFREFTGGSLPMVLRNLNKLIQSGENIIARIPVIPDFNHPGQDINEIIDYIVSLQSIPEIHFIPYHILGIEKYRMLRRNYDYKITRPVENQELKNYVKYAHSKGLKTRIGG